MFFIMSKSTVVESSMSSTTNDNMNNFVDKETIQTSQNELYSEGLFNPIYTFNGELTGYAGDCALCTGYLACPPRTNVLKEGIYFNDELINQIDLLNSFRLSSIIVVISYSSSSIDKDLISSQFSFNSLKSSKTIV